MKLIVTEKENAARRIADILSEGAAEAKRRDGVNVYRWGRTRVVGLSGHVVGLDFPPEYENWRDVEPVELVDAPVVTEPTQETIVAVLQDLAARADEVVIATDYDREGELIGKEAYELVRAEFDGPVKRVRFSSITDREVREAFANPDDLDFDLAAAGEARQIIDLVWGAALTRFLSLSARQFGDDFISVGRVQSPTLKLIVDREREIQAFDPETYWELFATLSKNGEAFEAQFFYDDDGSEAERVRDGDRAESVHERLQAAATARATGVRRRTRTDTPPDPLDTTAFISAAGSLGYSAQRAMSLAEELYTAGYITYPRTDNTVYPEDLDPADLVGSLEEGFPDAVGYLRGLDSLAPTAGDEETTDHPPIHPTGEVPAWGDLDEDERAVYELVVRHFFATVADPAEWTHLRIDAAVGDHRLKANGKRLRHEGYHAVYPYASTSENHLPPVEEGDTLSIAEARIEEKETRPPRRYGQSRLIEKMEELGLGTKCLTGDSEVLVRDKDGDLVRRRIDSMFETGRVVAADGDVDVATTQQSLPTLSLNEKRGKITEREQTLISKRSVGENEDVYRIETDRSEFSVTGDHPLYVWRGGGITTIPASEADTETELVATRRPSPDCNTESKWTVLTWKEFAARCDKNSKLYGTRCNTDLAERRQATGESSRAFAERLGTCQSAVNKYENSEKDVPVWLLGELGLRPDRLHGLDYDLTFENPFPLQWCPSLARLVASLLGGGSIHIDDEENVVDVRYHNTDPILIKRFVDDMQTLFDIRAPVTERSGRKNHHKTKYQVDVPSSVGRVLVRILDVVRDADVLDIPGTFQPIFVGALFDDEGHISREGNAFISNTDHELLTAVQRMLSNLDIESKLFRSQHKLRIRGRRNIERFLDKVPVSSDEKFYRGYDRLRQYDLTRRKARVLESIRDGAKTTEQVGNELGIRRALVQTTVRELREEGHVEKCVEGSNRSHDGNRTIRYRAGEFEGSIYATVCGTPGWMKIRSIEKRNYDGPVYDLTIDQSAPNFAVLGGAIIHNSTRHHVIEKLYDRGYIEDDPPRPTALAEAVVEATETFAEQVVTEEMTARLEADMDAIASGERDLSEVTEQSREMLEAVFESLRESREEIGEQIQESLKLDRKLGPCPECGETLLVRRAGDGSHFVGCDGFPDCRYTLPLPNTGEPLVLDASCEEHGLQHVKMLAGRNTFVHGCPRCAADEARETEDRVIGSCPECGDEAGGELAIKRLRSGSRLVGCTRYPDCEYSLPLPRRGDIEVLDARCGEHDLPELVVEGDDPWELGCPICNYREYQREQAVDDLEEIDGIGERTAEKLAAAGVEEPTDLDAADPDALAAEVQGVSADRLREWQRDLAG